MCKAAPRNAFVHLKHWSVYQPLLQLLANTFPCSLTYAHGILTVCIERLSGYLGVLIYIYFGRYGIQVPNSSKS